jgi:TetR/AcrR family transcriptional repressor of nem operon
MGRTSNAREQIIESALALWHERSYADVGVSEICEHANVRKGSFYHFFPAKSDLAVAVLDEQWRLFQEKIGGPLLRDPDTPSLERLDRLMDSIFRFATDWHGETGQIWGCPAGNLAVELATRDETVRIRVERLFEDWTDVFRQLLDDAVADGSIPPLDTRGAARAVLAYVQGAIVLAKTANDSELLAELGPAARRLIGAPENAPRAVVP